MLSTASGKICSAGYVFSLSLSLTCSHKLIPDTKLWASRYRACTRAQKIPRERRARRVAFRGNPRIPRHRRHCIACPFFPRFASSFLPFSRSSPLSLCRCSAQCDEREDEAERVNEILHESMCCSRRFLFFSPSRARASFSPSRSLFFILS